MSATPAGRDRDTDHRAIGGRHVAGPAERKNLWAEWADNKTDRHATARSVDPSSKESAR
jgi:hypothetical protein